MQRANAFRRLGHDVFQIDPEEHLRFPGLTKAWIYHLGGLGLDSLVASQTERQIGTATFDIAWIDPGDLVGPRTATILRNRCTKLVSLNLDNPFVSRDKYRWRNYLQALRLFDLFATPRESSAKAAISFGAKRAIRITQAADELMSRNPEQLSDKDVARYRSPVSFIGTWMPERGPFLASLIELGVPLKIFGPRWTKAPEYARLRDHVTAVNLSGQEYIKAIRCADIALCLLSKGNQDLHTTRSLEIPAVGSLLCAERTQDHLDMYEDGGEAIFFSNVHECAERCLDLLRTPDLIAKMAARGQARNTRNNHFNEKLLSRILSDLSHA
ncbi:glycosyltransferase [Bradyrhizobium sp. 62B]|uniref:CgeB family protein n=1 Tax=Bradyrhizobium sp. 62B TaxID=2898442 RepID=UPI002557F27E|nr:glycosyltransferase [Bradyrhizobium sp. 62B]